MHLVVVIFLQLLSFSAQKGIKSFINDDTDNEREFQLLLEEVMVKNLLPYKCVVVMSDSIYNNVFTKSWYRRFGPYITFIMIYVDDSEDLISPYEETQNSLQIAKNEGCQMYIILISNGLQVSRLLRFGDKYRVINTRAKFIILYDNRLFDKKLFYLWRRIINVIFVRRYDGQKNGDDPRKTMPWFELTTVPFPSQITSILVPRRLDIWTRSKFRKGADLFRDKTSDLRNQTLKVAAFAHIPGTAKNSDSQKKTVRAVVGNGSLSFSGAEVEILQTVSAAMNFKCEIYEPLNADVELWGGKQSIGKYTGLIGEMIYVDDSEDLISPYEETQNSLQIAKNEGCQMYIILISNGLQVSRLLRFGDKYRVINTRAKFIILYDNRLFDKKLFYLWRRIINVIFVRRYDGQKNGDDPRKTMPWFELTTVPFPSQITSILVPRRLDIWTRSKFRKGADLFRDKTSDLRNQTLKVAAFAHIPGTAKNSDSQKKTVRAVVGNGSLSFSGAEVEILQTVSAAMNFKCEIYEPLNADVELWGGKQSTGKYTGLIGEMVDTRADIALGDLYYTPYTLELMDLSVPYNTECLTFLTPESLTDNSWKTLILPFKPLMWAAVIICLLICGAVFYSLARFHDNISTVAEEDSKGQSVDLFNKKKKIITLSIYPEVDKMDPNVKYIKMKEQYVPPKYEGQAVGLYQFTEPFNSMLYTYSMLLLVSLPKLPTGWSLRMLTGWYWLYCLLLVVSYRASLTAILARPVPRVTIDTLQELVKSRLTCGGWGDINREFFKSSLDPTTKLIGENFEMVNDSSEAVDRVAQGLFAFYENSYFLKEALVKRQIRFQTAKSNNSTANQTQEMKDIAKADRTLHIMTDCVIKMPISIGLQKNSPIKPRVDKYIRKVLEAGLIKKWLDDVMSPILNAEVQDSTQGNKAIMSMQKFFGALVALFIGYFIGIVALIVEIIYFHYFVKRNPHYNKYMRTVYVKKAEKKE